MTEKQHYSLRRLNAMVKQLIEGDMQPSYWVVAEISEMNEHASGHCYMELLDKDEHTGTVHARARGNIWSRTYRMLKPHFETTTGQRLTSGMKVLLRVKVGFHEVYGYALTVLDIDASYTLGDAARRRMQILKRLEEEGVIGMNKELLFPLLPQRIALISSATAAGYQDFMHQLQEHRKNYAYQVTLFASIMQGESTEASVLEALGQIYERLEEFDVVVLVRGGGASADLAAFDSYELGTHVAQFPLPVITGIGHDKDETVVDRVAYRAVKTPTAAAALLLEIMEEADNDVQNLRQYLEKLVEGYLKNRKDSLQSLRNCLPVVLKNKVVDERMRLEGIRNRVKNSSAQWVYQRKTGVEREQLRLHQAVQGFLRQKQQELEINEKSLRLLNPQEVMKRGFSITVVNGKKALKATDLNAGDKMDTYFADGVVHSVVE